MDTNHSLFYRQFKKIKNMPPQAYRAQYLSAVK